MNCHGHMTTDTFQNYGTVFGVGKRKLSCKNKSEFPEWVKIGFCWKWELLREYLGPFIICNK